MKAKTLLIGEIKRRFREHSEACKKGNKCCYSPDNGSTQEFIQSLFPILESYTEDRAVAAREDVYRDFVKETDALKLKADMSAVAVAGELTRALKRVVIKSPLLKKEEPDV